MKALPSLLFLKGNQHENSCRLQILHHLHSDPYQYHFVVRQYQNLSKPNIFLQITNLKFQNNQQITLKKMNQYFYVIIIMIPGISRSQKLLLGVWVGLDIKRNKEVAANKTDSQVHHRYLSGNLTGQINHSSLCCTLLGFPSAQTSSFTNFFS